jgi:hypothetical protein
MRKKLYLSIIEQLRLIQLDEQGKYITALTLDDKKSVIKHLDIWNNNLQYIEQEPPFPTPALFLQFQPITWEIRSKGLRAADVAVTLHVVTSNIAPSNHKSQYETKAFEFLDLLDAINANLYGLKGDFFRNLVSTTSSTDHDHAELIDSLETYNVQVTDTSAVKVLPTTYVAPVVTTGFING